MTMLIKLTLTMTTTKYKGKYVDYFSHAPRKLSGSRALANRVKRPKSRALSFDSALKFNVDEDVNR